MSALHPATSRSLDLNLLHRRREEADTYEGERKSYIFDLDVREGAEDEDDAEKYSVDGYAHGTSSRLDQMPVGVPLTIYNLTHGQETGRAS